MSARDASDEVHIASFVVQADPACLPRVERTLSLLDGVDIHAVDSSGKLIVTIEAGNDAGITGCLDTVRHTHGVHCASLVYHQIEARHALDQELGA